MVWLLLGDATMAAGQGRSSEASPYIRVEWALERTRGELWTLCGSVYNDSHVPARHVELLVQTLDAAGRGPRNRVLHSVNDVPAGSRRIFCLPVPAGTTAGGVVVQAIDWGFQQAP